MMCLEIVLNYAFLLYRQLVFYLRG
jgi:hypothetical protein